MEYLDSSSTDKEVAWLFVESLHTNLPTCTSFFSGNTEFNQIG